MKKQSLIILSLCFCLGIFAPSLMAQEEEREGEEKPLHEFYRCNNSGRHYCRTPEHAAIVDKIVKGMVKRGVRITPQVIKGIAQRNHPPHN